MPVRYKTSFTPKGETSRCPTDYSAKLRNPLCREEPKPFTPHNRPKPPPLPPKPIPIKPIPIKPIPIKPIPPTPPTPTPPTPTPPTPSSTTGDVVGIIAGGLGGGAALGAGAGILAQRALQSAYAARMASTTAGEATDAGIELDDVSGAAEGELEPLLGAEPVPDTTGALPAGGAQDLDLGGEFDPADAADALQPEELEPLIGAAGESAGDATVAAVGGSIEMGAVDSEAVGISLLGAPEAITAGTTATAGFAAGITSFGNSVNQLSSNAIKLGARAVNAIKPTVAATPEEVEPLLDAAPEDVLGDLTGEALGGTVEGVASAETGTGLAAASGAEGVASSAIEMTTLEAGEVGAEAVAAETTADVAAAEATAAPFDFETFGVSAAVAAGAGAAVGAAAAAGILATVIPAFIAAHKQPPSATPLSKAQASQSLSVLETAVAKNPSLQPVIDMTKLAIQEGRPLYSVYDGTNTTLVSQLSIKNLAIAAANYNANPDLFKGTPKVQLQAMGLNPALSDGKLQPTKADNNIDNIISVSKQVFNTQNPTRQQLNQTANTFYGSSLSSVFDTAVARVPTNKFINTIKPQTTPEVAPPPTTGTTNTTPPVPLTPEQKGSMLLVGEIGNVINTLVNAPPPAVQTPQQAATQSVVGGISNIVNAITPTTGTTGTTPLPTTGTSAPATTSLPTTGTTAPALTMTSAPNPSLSASDQAIVDLFNSAT